MKIAVIGATSYVGYNLIRTLHIRFPDAQIKIAGRSLTKLEYLKKSHSNVISVHTMTQGDDVSDIVKDCDACVDLTYQISGIPSQIIKASLRHADNLVSACRKNGIRNLIIIGSVAIYGEPVIHYDFQDVPVPAKVNPQSLYGRIKLMVEKETWSKSKKGGSNLFLVRSGHIFGSGSKMAGGIAQRIIHGQPMLFRDRTAFSNATTTNGLCRSIIDLCYNTTMAGRFCGNHVDLSEIPHETIVLAMSEKIDRAPVYLDYEEAHARGKSLYGLIKKYKDHIALLQSKIGLYDFGISASMLLKSKPAFNAFKIHDVEAHASAGPLKSVFESDKVPHSSNLCGESLNIERFMVEMEQVSIWLNRVGYTI